MSKEKMKKIKCDVVETLPSLEFKVVDKDGNEILAYLKGKLRRNKIRILPGDKVLVEMSKYDDKRGRIIYRL